MSEVIINKEQTNEKFQNLNDAEKIFNNFKQDNPELAKNILKICRWNETWFQVTINTYFEKQKINNGTCSEIENLKNLIA